MRPTREETRERLLVAAAGVFAEHGVGAATVEKVVSAAGLTLEGSAPAMAASTGTRAY